VARLKPARSAASAGGLNVSDEGTPAQDLREDVSQETSTMGAYEETYGRWRRDLSFSEPSGRDASTNSSIERDHSR
jgi:hypothetical protein